MSVDIQDLTKRYGNLTAVDKVTLSIQNGELFALLGVNGAGKTTLIKMLTSLTRPDEGDAWLCGKSVTKEPHEVRKHIALSPQENAVAPHLTVRENLELMAGLHGLSGKRKEERVDEGMTAFSLLTMEKRQAGKLSGGWQRRLSLAMALVSEPDVLFLDEPTLGLDVIARRELWETIKGLKGRMTILLTTHYMEEAEALSDRVGLMTQGRLLCTDSPRGICEKAGCESFEDAFIKLVKEGDQ